MAAANAVLSTYELLEHIITYLHPVDVARAKSVAKAWHHIIRESPRLHDLRIPAPLDKMGTAIFPLPADSNLACLYDLGSRLRFVTNLGVRYSSEIPEWNQANGDLRRITEKGSELRFYRRGLRQEVLDEYATIPPCQAINLYRAMTGTSCVVYVKDGVKIRHLQKAAESMRQCGKPPRKGGKRRGNYGVDAWFAEFDPL